MHRLHDPRWRFGAVLIGAATLAAILIGASQLGSGEPTRAALAEPAQARERSLFHGIQQQGPALGSPKAPVTLVEYADLQCPYCAQWALQALPALVQNYVKPGKLRIVFRGLAFIGPDSDKALRTAIAAGESNRLWNVVHGLYEHQGAENAGWVTDGLVAEIAAGVRGLNGGKLLEARWQSSVEPELKRAAAAAKAAGVNGTPAFQIGPTGGQLQLVRVGSLSVEGIAPAIEAVLAR